MVFNIIALVILIAFSAFFSGSETAYSSANEFRLRKAAEEKASSKNKFAYFIYSNYSKAITAILIGNNLVNIASSSIGTVIVLALLGEEFAWVSTAVMTILVLIFGEIMPKIISASMPEKFAWLVAWPLRIIMIILSPLVWLVDKLMGLVSKLWENKLPDGPNVTEDDLENIIETVEDEGVIDEETSDLLMSALDFDDVLAYEIITPRVDIIAADIDDSFEEILEVALSSPYSRIPVYEDTIDNIIGILNIRRLFKRMLSEEQPDIRSLLMPVHFVHKTTPLPDVLSKMKANKSHMVMVSDEYGGVMGLLTMEDVLEQLVGDIWDESDEIEAEIVQINDELYDVDGDMRIYDFFEEMEIDDRDFDDDNATLGGFAIEMLGGEPILGGSFEYKNLTITIRRLRKRRVERLAVTVNRPPEDPLNDFSDI